MSTQISKRLLTSLLLCTVFFGSACSDDAVTPGVEPEVSNSPDNFRFHIKSALDHSGTLDYIWTNTGAAADVDQSCDITGGGALLVINDAAGARVYSRSLAEEGSFETSEGEAGAWKIRVVFSGSSGMFDFQVRKRE
jgi:hypothetical protein